MIPHSTSALYSLPVVIGTRASPLALAQARETQARLMDALELPADAFYIHALTTSGDRILDRSLADAGGKGLFTKEIDAAQCAGHIHIAVHSAKDLPAVLADGLMVAGYLPREDPRDAVISRTAASLLELPLGAVVATASVRRGAFVKRLRSDLETVMIRGNVGTRLAKLEVGLADATILATAGLNRLGLSQRITAFLDVESFLPCAGQGAIALVVREEDAAMRDVVARVACQETGLAVLAERAFLGVLDGSCRTPIGAYAMVVKDRIWLRGLVLRPDGGAEVAVERHGSFSDCEAMGLDAGREALARSVESGVLPALT